jgi:hypothetical protein
MIRRRAPGARAARKATFECLEPRKLLTLTGFDAEARPRILFPANDRSVPVVVTGTVTVQEKRAIPSVNFQVVDEYRRVQPAGPVKAKRVPGQQGAFAFSFTVPLQAKVRAHDKSGRQYYIVVAARESTGSVGKVLAVLVPNPDIGVPPGGDRAIAARVSSP